MDPVQMTIDGTLDLHTFRPDEINILIPEYLHECRKAGIKEVRIIHGKGKGILRRSVHAILSRCDLVKDYRTAGADAGHWGATLVTLN
ncbi:MAG: DNA mismatch repair protein MutS [Thermodesulfatator sp.]|nr:MAG: DNA mismatch repair protein MutS [Thermodesulfatator sp.]